MIVDSFQRIAQETYSRVVEPLHNIPFNITNRWFFLYLGLSIVFALALLTWRKHHRSDLSMRESLHAALRTVFDKHILFHRSSLLDYRYALINHVLTASVVIYLIGAVGVLSEVFFGLFSQLTFLQGVGIEIGWLGFVLVVFMFAFANDTGNFFQHYMQHKIPILWEFHKVHHSAEVLTPVTAVRRWHHP